MMIRFKSVTFYKYINPDIKNGGLYGDSKMETYKLLPENYYPKTIKINKGCNYNFQLLINEFHLSFPLILKPDIGCRGMNVELVSSITEIEKYKGINNFDFLIQEYVDLPNEIGLFYIRMPDKENGIISGITIKNFITIKGNGTDTIEQLLKKNKRHEMQIMRLKEKINLSEVLEQNKTRCLVPYGNHSRGTEFLDGSKLTTQNLQTTFDEILSRLGGFYYGRLDIRFNNFEDLEQGKNFSVIEVNGAKSEPTHIYDPKHTFLYAQKEIFRHQNFIYEIVKANLKRK